MLGAITVAWTHDVLRFVHSLAPGMLLAGSIYVVERRGKRAPLDPRRQVDITTLLESIPDAALIIDQRQRVIDANSAAAQIAGCTREQLRYATAEQINRLMHGTDPERQESPIVVRALGGESVRHERRILRNPQNGEDLELLVSATPIRADNGGDVIGALVIASDVTELHALQRRMGDVERHLAIGQMAAALAHDFNNILAAITQAAYVLQNEQAGSEQERKTFLDIIQNAARRGSEIIARVREYLRNGSGALGPVDVRQVISEAIELTRPLWSKAKLQVECQLKPVRTVRANAADLRRVFTNLIINAMDAMPNGGRMALTCEDRENKVVATVADTGVGIRPEARKKIFYPYFTTKPKGTGLGLSGAQKILLSQGGNISFSSEVGKGTTFVVTFPAIAGVKTEDKAPRDINGGNGSTLGHVRQKKPAA